jgi:hypothetical protein
MDDSILIQTILEALAVLARHFAGERASADETRANLFKLFDSAELVEELAKRDIRAWRSGNRMP